MCLAGFGIIGCQGALNASAGLIYPSNCRTTGVGAALGMGRVGSLAGPLVGGYRAQPGVPVQQMFYVPMMPLGLAALATGVLLLRKVDIRRETESGTLTHGIAMTRYASVWSKLQSVSAPPAAGCCSSGVRLVRRALRAVKSLRISSHSAASSTCSRTAQVQPSVSASPRSSPSGPGKVVLILLCREVV